MQNDDEAFDFNYWTSFADLMLALVLVLSLLLFVVVAVISFNTVNLKHVEDNQSKLIGSIAEYYKVKAVPLKSDEQLKRYILGISTNNNNIYDIKIQNELNVQRITFSDKLLFRPDEVVINPGGQEVLSVVGQIINSQLRLIKEIQIEGHADTTKSSRFHTNTELAAMRAIAVFEYLRQNVGIDPNKKLMSITSFGEFKSVQRGENEESDYSSDQLIYDNAEEKLRSYNRRIEIVLTYKRKEAENE
jgi:flagellar motor protein MotB